MLEVADGLPLVNLAGLEELRRAGAGEGQRLQAEHAAQLQRARADTAEGHRHDPVLRLELGDAARAALTVDAELHLAVQHQQPLARRPVPHVHRRRGGLPRRARSHLPHRHEVRPARADAHAHLFARHHHQAARVGGGRARRPRPCAKSDRRARQSSRRRSSSLRHLYAPGRGRRGIGSAVAAGCCGDFAFESSACGVAAACP